MTQTDDLDKRTLTIMRTFGAPRQLVWDAWTQVEHIAQWWGPPGMDVKINKHEFREGGDWEYAMTMPDGREFLSLGTYARIEPPDLLETTANFIPMTKGVIMIAKFTDAGERTEFEFQVIHPTVEYCQQQEAMGFYNGWGSAFHRLDELLGTVLMQKQ